MKRILIWKVFHGKQTPKRKAQYVTYPKIEETQGAYVNEKIVIPLQQKTKT